MAENWASDAADPAGDENSLNMYDKVPENMPSIFRILSPVAIKSFRVERTGSPAPMQTNVYDTAQNHWN
jgi:hypothetical protein